MVAHKLFRDRAEAGRRLARRLLGYREASPVVVGLPRGGVPVAFEVARELGAPLDVCVVRKIGAPIRPELGIGAVSEEGEIFVDRDMQALVGVGDDELAKLVVERRAELEERVRRLRRGAPPVDVRGRTVLVVDDGIATGGTARAALQTLRARGARKLVLAVPVAAASSLDALQSLADEIVCLHAEEAFHAVGLWYEDFSTTTDDDVVSLLDRASGEIPHARTPSRSERVKKVAHRAVEIPLPSASVGRRRPDHLEGALVVPPDAIGVVLFAHGSGSSRNSPRNQLVASELRREGIGTLLFDLLSDAEARIDARTMRMRFDIDLLASRLLVAAEWTRSQIETRGLPIGYFGASTGAAAALVAAAARPELVRAVVSRGGRPDLAGASLERVSAPTLLLVGGDDAEVLGLNRAALGELRCEKALEVVPGATHLFEEPGALDEIARAASRWFARHLRAGAVAATA